MDITYQYIKLRKAFGKQPLFCEQGPELCDSIHPDIHEQRKYMLRNPVNESIQQTSFFSEKYVNTIRPVIASTGANHGEGGWPKDVNVQDPEATQRYRRKVEKDDAYIHCVNTLSQGMEHYVTQNNAIDMYQTYYSELEAQPPIERISCRTLNVYRDDASVARNVSSISWQPDGGHNFAVTCLNVDFYREPVAPTHCFIWNIERATTPLTIITPPTALLDLRYNPKDPNLLVGGLLNGQVGYWDCRTPNTPVALCPVHVAHRDLVRNVMYINSKSGSQFFSAGPDGACKWWDVRKFTDPTDELIIDPVTSITEEPSMARSNAISVLEYEHTIPTRFMVGTENGLIIGANRKGKSHMEKLPLKLKAHAGPVYSLARNPAFLKNFLTVGDWTARVWSEDCRESSILWSPPQRYRFTAGTWSPTRHSSIIFTQSSGIVSVWDLNRRQHAPVIAMQVCEEPLLTLKVHEQATLVACGSAKGTVYLVELSQSLAYSDLRDKNHLTAIFERESHRERILEARRREIRLKLRQAEESSIHSTGEPDSNLGDRDLNEAYSDFMHTVRKELSAM